MKSMNLTLSVIASFAMSILANWVYDILKANGTLPASPNPVKILLGGVVFFTSLVILSREFDDSPNATPKMSWLERLDRIGVFIQKVFIGFGISILVIFIAYFALIYFYTSSFSRDLISGEITQEQYNLYVGFLSVCLFGGTIGALSGGQMGVFTKGFRELNY